MSADATARRRGARVGAARSAAALLAAAGAAAAAGVIVAAAPAAARAEPAAARPRAGFFARTFDEASALLASAAAARPPALHPPAPIAVTWKARRLTSIDLGAPLLELAAGDLDGDGRAELVALTTREVIVLGARGSRALAELARAPLPADPPGLPPRDPVGTVVVTRAPAEIWARASTAGRGARYALSGGALRELAAIPAFPQCAAMGGRPARSADLVAGRDYFGGDGPLRVFALRCTDELVDASGRALIATASLGPGGVLDVGVATWCAAGDASCPAERHSQLAGVGVAFALADVDRDGRPDVIASGDGAPGDPDQIAVYALPAGGGAPGKPTFRRKFTGGVAGVVAADLDGNGDLEVVAAVRLPGAARVDLWLLD